MKTFRKFLIILALAISAAPAFADNAHTFDNTNDTFTGTFTSTYNSTPMTLMCWYKVADAPGTVQDSIIVVGNSASAVEDSNSVFYGNGANDNTFIAKPTNSSAQVGNAVTTSNSTEIDGNWIPIIGVFTSSTLRDSYTPANTGQNTTSRVVADVIKFVRLGETFIAGNDLAADLSYCAMWNVAVTGANLTALRSTSPKNCPLKYDGANIVGFWDMQANSGTQPNRGSDAGGDLTRSGTNGFNTSGPGIDCTPTYTGALTIGSVTTTTIQNTYTPDQNGVTYGAYCPNGQTIGTGANVEAGTCSGGAAVATCSDSSTATVSDSITCTGLSAGTTYDAYFVHKAFEAYSAVTSKADQTTSSSAPTFDTGVACAAIALDANSLLCSYDAGATANRIFLCAKAKGSSAPADGAAVEAGTGCSGTATENTTGSSDSLQIDFAGDPLAEQDVWGVLEEGTSNYSTLSTDLVTRFTAPTGYQYLNRSGSPGVGEFGFFDGASPAIVDDDTMQVSLTSDSFALGVAAHGVTLNADTTGIIDTDGDLSRQLVYRRFSDYSVPAQSDATPQPMAFNDIAPAYVGSLTYLFTKDAALSFPLDGEWLDMEADAMTHAVANMPSGGSLTSSETITGAFSACGTFNTVQFTATDTYGEDTAQTVTIEVGAIVPDVLDEAEADGVTDIEALCSLNAVAGLPLFSATVATGDIISTDPIAGEEVPHDATIIYIVSLGPQPVASGTNRGRFGLGLGIH